MNERRKALLLLTFSISAAFLLLAVLAPILAMVNRQYAAPIYTLLSYACHQFPYRSFCFTENLAIENCITPGENASGYAFDYSHPAPIHPLTYSKKLIGIERSEILIKDGKRLYKFGICARDTGFFLGTLLASVIFYFIKFKPKWYLVIPLFFPMILDGTVQLLTSYESNNTIRLFTGFLAGTGLVLLAVALLVEDLKKK